MDEFLKPFTLFIQILSPVHIGSGDKLTKVDFLIDKGRMVVIDQQKLLNWIRNQPNVEILAQRLSEALAHGDLAEFLKNYFRDKLEKITSYSLPFNGAELPREILEFIKTGRGYPLVPGTSIKGSLRSAWLRGRMLGDQSLIRKTEALIYSSSPKHTNSYAIQAQVFVKPGINPSKQQNYDLNRLIVIRDSEPLDASEVLQVSKVQILSIKNRTLERKLKKTGRVMEFAVETLKPGLTISIPVIIQSNLLQKSSNELGFNGLQEMFWTLPGYCRKASFNLLEQEVHFLKRYRCTDLCNWYEKRLSLLQRSQDVDFILPMGWGSGYDAKTITDLLSEEVFKHVVETFKSTKGLGKPGRNPVANWLGKADSPKSRKVVINDTGDLIPMGWVAARLQPDPEAEQWFDAQRHKYKKVLDLSQPKTSPSSLAPSSSVLISQSPSPTVSQQELDQSPKKALVTSFTTPPRPGDCFVGQFFGEENDKMFLEIPGLDSDTQAYAIVLRSEYPFLPKKISSLKVEVVQLTEEIKEYWRVFCKPAN